MRTVTQGWDARIVNKKSTRDYFDHAEMALRGQIRKLGVVLSPERPYLFIPEKDDWIDVSIIYFGLTRRFDSDSANKAAIDALEKGRVFKNDNQVDSGSWHRSRVKGRKECVLRVELIKGKS